MDIKSKIKADGSNVVDVRSKAEYFMGHVKGSINIPLNTVPECIEEIRGVGEPIVLCCASGARSGQAVQYLQNQGFKEIYNGGGWRDVKHSMA